MQAVAMSQRHKLQQAGRGPAQQKHHYPGLQDDLGDVLVPGSCAEIQAALVKS